jgi:hypothetical protein
MVVVGPDTVPVARRGEDTGEDGVIFRSNVAGAVHERSGILSRRVARNDYRTPRITDLMTKLASRRRFSGAFWLMELAS